MQSLYGQAHKAYYNQFSLLCKVNLDFRTKLRLFDSLLVTIILYGSEILGIYSYSCKEVDILYVKFCKYLLGVQYQTPNAAVFGDLGRYPLSIICKERVFKYCITIMKCTNKYIYYIPTINTADFHPLLYQIRPGRFHY